MQLLVVFRKVLRRGGGPWLLILHIACQAESPAYADRAFGLVQSPSPAEAAVQGPKQSLMGCQIGSSAPVLELRSPYADQARDLGISECRS